MGRAIEMRWPTVKAHNPIRLDTEVGNRIDSPLPGDWVAVRTGAHMCVMSPRWVITRNQIDTMQHSSVRGFRGPCAMMRQEDLAGLGHASPGAFSAHRLKSTNHPLNSLAGLFGVAPYLSGSRSLSSSRIQPGNIIFFCRSSKRC